MQDNIEIVDIEEICGKRINVRNDDFYIKDGVLLKVFKHDGKVAIPDDVIKVGTMTKGYEFRNNDESVFLDDNNIEHIILYDSVKEIGSNFLEGCNNLKKITFGDKVEKIGDCAFCTSIIGGVACASLPMEFVIYYDNYDKLVKLLDEMISSNSFKFVNGKAPKYKFTLVGVKLKKIEVLKLSKKFIEMKVNKVKYVDYFEKVNIYKSLVECLNIINNKVLPKDNRDINESLSHEELIKVKFMDINKSLLELNLDETTDKDYRNYLIGIVKSALKDLGNNVYDKYEMQNILFDINISLIDIKETYLLNNILNSLFNKKIKNLFKVRRK